MRVSLSAHKKELALKFDIPLIIINIYWVSTVPSVEFCLYLHAQYFLKYKFTSDLEV